MVRQRINYRLRYNIYYVYDNLPLHVTSWDHIVILLALQQKNLMFAPLDIAANVFWPFEVQGLIYGGIADHWISLNTITGTLITL